MRTTRVGAATLFATATALGLLTGCGGSASVSGQGTASVGTSSVGTGSVGTGAVASPSATSSGGPAVGSRVDVSQDRDVAEALGHPVVLTSLDQDERTITVRPATIVPVPSGEAQRFVPNGPAKTYTVASPARFLLSGVWLGLPIEGGSDTVVGTWSQLATQYAKAPGDEGLYLALDAAGHVRVLYQPYRE